MKNTSREFVSGLTAGGVTTLVMHPLDLIKVRLQVDPSRHQLGYISQLVRRAVSDGRGVFELYRGIGPNLIGNTLSWGLYFMLYQKFVTSYATPGESGHYMLCALAAGTTTSALTNPIWVLKTRMLSTGSSHPDAYNSMREGVKRILKDDGIKGFWRGFGPGLLGVFQASIQFALYSRFKEKRQRTLQREKLGTEEYLALSALSKCVATVSMYPYQVVRSRLQVHRSQYSSAADVIKRVYLHEGVSGFYKGMTTNLVRVVPATCITFVVYENVKAAL